MDAHTSYSEGSRLLATADPGDAADVATSTRPLRGSRARYVKGACLAAALVGAGVAVSSWGSSRRARGVTEMDGTDEVDGQPSSSSSSSAVNEISTLDFTVANSYGARPSMDYE